jgi:hypothetical protein
MSETPPIEGEREAAFARLSARFGFSVDAVRTMHAAIERGNGRMAQFDQPEFGGHGQWMAGGMLMLGDMFNDALKARVSGLCNELAQLPASRSEEKKAGETLGAWWPAEFGRPQSAGGQNRIRYAYFSRARRLVLDREGKIDIYDTGDHEIFGVQQQQSRDATLKFTSQHGSVDITELQRL